MRARQRSQCNGGEVFVTAQGEERRGEARKAGGAQNQGIGGDTPWAFSFRWDLFRPFVRSNLKAPFLSFFVFGYFFLSEKGVVTELTQFLFSENFGQLSEKKTGCAASKMQTTQSTRSLRTLFRAYAANVENARVLETRRPFQGNQLHARDWLGEIWTFDMGVKTMKWMTTAHFEWSGDWLTNETETQKRV